MSRKLEHVFTLQQGDSGTLRVADQTAWHVVREVWQGRQLLDTRVVSRHHARAEAEAARQQAETAHKVMWG
jgi:hypothetical protein